MRHRFTAWSLFSTALVSAACSPATDTSPGGSPPAGTDAAACLGDLPPALEVSEGGAVTLRPPSGTTLEGRGGAVVIERDSDVVVRMPYVASAESEVSIALGCGATIPVTLRPITWTKLADWKEDEGAKAREYGAWWIDPAGSGALVVFGGFHYVPKQFTPANDAWRFDFATSAWAPLAGTDLPILPGGRAATIPGERAVYVFGGALPTEDGSLDTPPSLYRIDHDDTTITPTKLDADAAPGSYTGGFVYDSKRSRWLSFCGGDSTIGLHCRVSAYTPDAGFSRVTTAGDAPDGRNGFHFAYDEATDRVIVFGGQVGSGNEAIAGDTWALDLAVDPPRWELLVADGEGATKRRNGAYALDPVGHRLFVWGGTPDGMSPVKGIQALSLDRGSESWTDIATPTEVPPRTSALAAYDADRSRIVVGFGNSAAIYRDLWSIDVANGP